jgi:hypothetical protein
LTERLLDELPDGDVSALIGIIEQWIDMDKDLAEAKVDFHEYSGDVAEAFEQLVLDQDGHRRSQEAMRKLQRALEEERDARQRRQDGA